MKLLVIVRGLPGSGKSTLAKKLSQTYHEADQYMQEDGRYCFDPAKLQDAHLWCQYQVLQDMQNGNDLIVVSNTFCKKWEIEPYEDMADKYGYQIQYIICKGPWRNIHNCPDDKLISMAESFEY